MEIVNLTAEGQYAITQRLTRSEEAVRSAILPDLALTLQEIFS